jgi:hypothetical protein
MTNLFSSSAMKFRLSALVLVPLFIFAPAALHAWGYDGHRIVNQLALAALPADFPAFAKTPANSARILYLANLPDRWRNVDPALKQSGSSWTDHFFDLEQLVSAGLDAHALPPLRIDFAVQFAAARAAHADQFSPIEPEKNTDHTREWPGFAPWALTEWFHRLQSGFSYLKAYQDLGGTPEEIANAQADIVYTMGVMGHYFGDCAQPLHTTIHHNGWVGANLNGYSTWPGFHSWIDSGFIEKAHISAADLLPRVAAAEPLAITPISEGRDAFFTVAIDFLLAQNALVEPLYKLEKQKLLGHGEQEITPEGRAFVEGQLLVGGNMLGRVWLTAWKSAPVDTFLRNELAKRQAKSGDDSAPAKKKKKKAEKAAP